MQSTIMTSAEHTRRERDVLGLSRGASIVLIIVYLIYLWTQMKSDKFSYKPLIEFDEPDTPGMQEGVELCRESVHRRTLSYPKTQPSISGMDIESQSQRLDVRVFSDLTSSATFPGNMNTTFEKIKSASWIRKTLPVILIVVSTGLISLSGSLLVSSIDHFVEHSPISKTMVGLVILPIVGNAAELISGIMFAHRKQIDLAFAVCIGSAIQIALFVAPLVVLLGWIMGREMSLQFSMFEAITLVASTVLFISLVFDERCSSLKGFSLLAGYTTIGYVMNFQDSVKC